MKYVFVTLANPLSAIERNFQKKKDLLGWYFFVRYWEVSAIFRSLLRGTFIWPYTAGTTKVFVIRRFPHYKISAIYWVARIPVAYARLFLCLHPTFICWLLLSKVSLESRLAIGMFYCIRNHIFSIPMQVYSKTYTEPHFLYTNASFFEFIG